MTKIGDNGGPTLDPFAAIAAHIDDLKAEAKLHLDGKPVETQAQCDALDKLREEAIDAEKLADDARKAEKKPHDDASKAVQVKWKPFVDDVVRIKEAARLAAAPWKRKMIEDANKEAERVAALARAAQEAAQAEAAKARADSNLEAIEASEQALASADTLSAMAKKAAKPIATGLRTYWYSEIEDYNAYFAHVKANHLDEFKAFLQDQALKDVLSGARVLPGVRIWSEQR